VRVGGESLTPAKVYRALILVLVAAMRRVVHMLVIDVIGKCHVNAGKTEQLDTLARTAHFISGTYAFRRLISVRLKIGHFAHPFM